MDIRVLGDWGGSRLRLWRLVGDTVAERREGPGILGLAQPAIAVLSDAIASWREQGPIDRISLCGMAGARGGLRDAGYAVCPVTAAVWASKAARFTLDGIPVRIAAGAAAGKRDVMRGEETQAFGAFLLAPALAEGSQTMVLPGTHSKWLSVDDGAIVTLRTFFTGELFAMLRSSSLIDAGGSRDSDAEEGDGFAAGVARAAEGPGLLGALFTARAAQLRQGRSPRWAVDYLSGLLIGTEIAEMRKAGALPAAVTLIGDPTLAQRYLVALASFGIAAETLDGEACSLAGLRLLDAYD